MKKYQKLYPKSVQNLWKSRLGLVPGALGEGLGCHFGPQSRLGQQKGARCQKLSLRGFPFGAHLGVIFHDFGIHFLDEIYDGFQEHFFHDFDIILTWF